jgi:hypothetical protein
MVVFRERHRDVAHGISVGGVQLPLAPLVLGRVADVAPLQRGHQLCRLAAPRPQRELPLLRIISRGRAQAAGRTHPRWPHGLNGTIRAGRLCQLGGAFWSVERGDRRAHRGGEPPASPHGWCVRDRDHARRRRLGRRQVLHRVAQRLHCLRQPCGWHACVEVLASSEGLSPVAQRHVAVVLPVLLRSHEGLDRLWEVKRVQQARTVRARENLVSHRRTPALRGA